ncbi:MAG TPA: hypothetical protein VIM11_08660 [Tepidisphaeraceae bacterium]|jgi:hypothetical protein
MQSGIDTLNESDYSPNGNENRGEWLNTWIEIALLWLALIVVIACWR